MFSNVPADQRGHPLTSVASNANATVGGTSARVALNPGSSVVRICSNTDCYIAFGNSGVVASSSDAVFVKGAEVVTLPPGSTHTHVAFLQVTAGGVASVTSMV